MASAVIPILQIADDAARKNNAVLVRLLALCPMLAVSVSVSAAAVLGALTAGVTAVSGASVAAMRNTIPESVRLPVSMLLVASLVAACDIFTEALAPEMHRRLGIFLPLITTNCAVLARLEVFARRNTPAAAVADGAATGLGMLAALVVFAAARELLSSGGVAPFFSGEPVLVSAALPAGGFMIFGLMLAAARKLKLPAA